MIAVVGLMTQFRHLNHILNINDPFTLSQAECNSKPFSGSFIGRHTVLRLHPQSAQKKFNWNSLHCNNTIRREQTSACRAQSTLHLWPRFTGFWMETCLPDTGPQLTDVQMNQRGNSSCQAFNNRKMRNETSWPAETSALSLAKQSQNTWLTLYLRLKPTAPASNAAVTSNNTHLIDRVQQLRWIVPFLIWLLPLFCLAQRRLWGWRKRQSSPRWWRLHSHHN